MPTSIVRIPRRVAVIGPMVDPHGTPLCETNSWTFAPAARHQPFHAAFLEIVEQRAEGLEAVMGINPRHRCLDAIEGDADRVGIGLGQRLGHGAAPGQDRQFSGHGAQPPGVR